MSEVRGRRTERARTRHVALSDLRPQTSDLSRHATLPLIRLALREDAAARDVTSRAILAPNARIRARIIAKASGILAGGQVAAWTFQAVDPRLRCILKRRDGAQLSRGTVIMTIEGRARAIFAAERTALNVLGHLSGTATLTRRFVRRAGRAAILDTRKTLPGLRALEKHAVRAGGGQSHRNDLAEAVLIKTNHLRAISHQPSAISQAIREAVQRAKRQARTQFIEIEVTNLQQLKAALEANPGVILLDNWRLANIRKAVALRHSSLIAHHSSSLLEVSGGVTLANVRAIASAGVDRISIGRLTHSAPSLDVSLHVT